MALTNKQEKFVQGLVAGKTQRQAYLDAGYSDQNGQLDRVDVQASKLFADAKVLQRYEYLYNKVIKNAEKKIQWSFEKSMKELVDLIEEAKNYSVEEIINDEVKVKKLELKDKAKVILDSIKELNSMNGYNQKNVNSTVDFGGDFEIVIKGEEEDG